MLTLPKNAWSVVERWLSERDQTYLRKLVINLKVKSSKRINGKKVFIEVLILQAVIVTVLTKRHNQGNTGFKLPLEANLMILRILNRINVEKDLIMDYEDFYIPEVNDLIFLPEAYYRWLMEKSQPGGSRSHAPGNQMCNFQLLSNAWKDFFLRRIPHLQLPLRV